MKGSEVRMARIATTWKRRLAGIGVACGLAASLLAPTAAFAVEAPIAPADEGQESLALTDSAVNRGIALGTALSGTDGASLQADDGYAPTFNLDIIGDFHQTEARKLLDLINQARARVGVQPLVYDTNLEAVALMRAAEIQLYFDHTRPNGFTCNTAALQLGVDYGNAYGENILMGATTATYANQLWTGSEGHYHNMISDWFTSVGVAAFEMNGTWCWVEFFGATPGTGFNVDAINGTYAVSTDAQAVFLPYVFEDVNPKDWYVASDNGENFTYTLNNGLMTGYSDRAAFGPYDSITRGQVATILWRMAGEPSASSSDFSDVDYGAYYGPAVRWARATGVVNGYAGTNNFGPNDKVSREQLCAMLSNYASKIAGLDVSSTMSLASALKDWGSVSSWAREAMGWALDEGIMSGVQQSDGSRALQPQATAQRCQMATMIAVFHRDVL